MALNLLDSITELTSNGFTTAAARLVGEAPASTKAAIGYMLPAAVGGVAKQGSTPEGASTMMDTLAQAPSVSELGDLGTLSSPNRANTLVSQGAGFARRLFGDRTPPVADTVASLTGVKPESVSTLFFVTLPMILAVLKQYVASNGLDTNGLRQLLGNQLKTVQAKIDPRVAAAAGLVPPAASVPPPRDTSVRPPAPSIAPTTAAEPSGLRRLVPWAALAAAALLVFTLLRGRSTPHETTVPAVAANTTATAVAPAAANTTATTSPGEVAPTATVALPMSVHFDVSSATLSPTDAQSLATLGHQITQDNTHVDITGYTDPTGNHSTNVELAKHRAVAVRNALESAGVSASAINMKPPADITGSGTADDARRVDVTQSQ
jgi:outer membrane protein OmpA-like peptidoglycan-associated protein